MSTDRPSIAAADREVTGKAVKRLRRDGRLPAVVYGHGVDSANLSVDAHEFGLLHRRTGPNTLIDLTVDGSKATPVLVHGVQVHPVTRTPLHVDFFLVRMTEELTVDVPLVPVGDAPAVSLQGGTLHQVTESVRMRALPDHLPQSIEYSVESLVDFDAAIYVRDLAVPADAALLSDLDEVVAKVLQPRVVEAELPRPEGEGAEAVEAVTAEGEAASDAGGTEAESKA